MNFTRVGEEMRLYFKHTSGRNFVIVDKIENGDEATAKRKLLERMREMNK